MTDKLLIDRAVVEQALEAIEALEYLSNLEERIFGKICDKLRAALAEQPAEQSAEHGGPVAYVCPSSRVTADGSMEDGPDYLEWADEASDYEKRVGTPLYTAPQPAKPAERVPLTDDEIDAVPWGPHDGNPITFAEALRDFARAIEAAHGITGGTK